MAFAYDFEQVKTEYNRDQFRDLKSFTLMLNAENKQAVLEAALEAHWTHRGNYYFLSNNCAVETLNLLKSALPQYRQLQELISVAPSKLLSQFISIGFAKKDLFAEQISHSKESTYKTKFLQIVDVLALSEQLTWEEFLAFSPEQLVTFLGLSSFENLSKKDKLSLLLIVSRLRNSLELKLIEQHLHELKNSHMHTYKRLTEFGLKIGEYADRAVTPGLLIQNGYGIPSEAEVAHLSKSEFWNEFSIINEESSETLRASLSFTPSGHSYKATGKAVKNFLAKILAQ